MIVHLNFEVGVLHIKKKNLNVKAKQIDFLMTMTISQWRLLYGWQYWEDPKYIRPVFSVWLDQHAVPIQSKTYFKILLP